jgi:hypothetical protein
MTAYDTGCVKTPRLQSYKNDFQIVQNRPRSEIVIVLISIRGEIYLINSPGHDVLPTRLGYAALTTAAYIAVVSNGKLRLRQSPVGADAAGC